MKKNPHAVALGKRGGKVKSDAKAQAARKNGQKGGRPKLTRAFAWCSEHGITRHPRCSTCALAADLARGIDGQ